MPRFDVSGVFTRERERLQGLRKGSAQAQQRAVSTLARRLPVVARRDIQEEFALKAMRVNEGLSVTRQQGAVLLTGSKRPIGLIEFGGRWSRKQPGATATVFQQGGRETYRGSFIATGRSGNRQIFVRTGPDRTAKIKALYGPSVAAMLKNPERANRLADIAQSILSAEITRLLEK